MTGSESKPRWEQDRSNAGWDLVGDWAAPIVAFIFMLGLLLALVGAMLAPAD